jgi:hypothetical protein
MGAKAKAHDADEMWCAVELRIRAAVLDKQCEHATSAGRYVFLNYRGALCGFDPATKLQALSWTRGHPGRHDRIRWLCFECGNVMPLGSYEK